MSNPLRRKEKKVESSIPNWVVYALLSIVSLIIAKSLHGALVTFTASGIVVLLILSYMSKPIADIQPLKEETIFDKNKINKTTWRNPSEPNAQRRRYLKSIDDDSSLAA